ncbi:hypothetical protein [Microbispora sp. NPDC049125]|uniref:hypothetical protein n=1 Tax=Microbispora sp. NPDC049125 TaxID=3154929 RepID=UPI003467679A
MKLTSMSGEEVKAYCVAALADIKYLVNQGAPAKAYKPEKDVLSQLPLQVYWKVPVFACLTGDGTQVGVIAASFNKRPVGEWGLYVNAYIVHTRLRHRGNGHAVAAYQAIAHRALDQGYSRITTTAATFGGWATHRALGWPAWGLNAQRQIVTDADLTGAAPEGLPARCAKLDGPGRPLTPTEHAKALTDPYGPYRLRREDLPPAYQEAP